MQLAGGTLGSTEANKIPENDLHPSTTLAFRLTVPLFPHI